MYRSIIDFFPLINREVIWFTIRYIYCFDNSIKNCFTSFIFQRFNLTLTRRNTGVTQCNLTRSFTGPYVPVFKLNAGKYVPGNSVFGHWPLFTQCAFPFDMKIWKRRHLKLTEVIIKKFLWINLQSIKTTLTWGKK